MQQSKHYQFNSALLFFTVCGLLIIHLLNYAVVTIADTILPLGNLVYGLAVYVPLAVAYWRMQLHRQAALNPWLVLYVIYITLSFLYGVKRYGTITVSVYDYWFFLYIPAILLIPPGSFNVKLFDRLLAVGVVLSCVMMVAAVVLNTNTLYDRLMFSRYLSSPASIGTGAIYLAFKYAKNVNLYTYIGLGGILVNAVLYGVGGAFRGMLILSVLTILLFLAIQLRTLNTKIGWKLLSFGVLGLTLVGAFVFVVTQFQDQLHLVAERFVGIFDRFTETGDAALSDSRLKEIDYFMQLNSNWKLILGHGVGALWYDFFGMFGAKTGGTFAGARTMLHMNWMHVTFKIGVVGFILLIGLIVRSFRQRRGCLYQNYGWWAFFIWFCAYMTYYGPKELGIGTLVYLTVLVHPWLFLDSENRPNSRPHNNNTRPHTRRLAGRG